MEIFSIIILIWLKALILLRLEIVVARFLTQLLEQRLRFGMTIIFRFSWPKIHFASSRLLLLCTRLILKFLLGLLVHLIDHFFLSSLKSWESSEFLDTFTDSLTDKIRCARFRNQLGHRRPLGLSRLERNRYKF